MATTIETLTAQLSVDLRRYEKGFLRANKLTDKRLSQMEKRFDRGADKMAKSGARMAQGFNKAIAAIGVGYAVRESVRLSDAYTEAANKIKSTEIAFGGALGNVSEITKIANNSRSSLTATVDLYTRLARAGGALGKTQIQIAKATEVANKSFKAHGATIAEQNSAILQLSQGLQSGALQGEELRAIRENAPLLARAIADAMGVSIGELKKLGSEGKITADIIFEALTSGAKKIEDQYAATGGTIGDSFTRLRNEAIKFIGTSEDAATAADALSKFILVVANNLDLLAHASVIAAVSIGGTLAGKAMVQLVTSLVSANLLLGGVTGNLARVTAASILAGRATNKFNLALKAVGGPYALIIGGIALAILSVVKANKKAAIEQVKFNKRLEEARAINEKYKSLLEGTAKSLNDQTTQVNKLAKAYKTLAGRAEEAGEAQKLKTIEGISERSAQLLSDRLAKEKELKKLRSNSGRLGAVGSLEKQKILQAEILEIEIQRASFLQNAKVEAKTPNEEKAAAIAERERQETARKKIEDENALAIARARGDKSVINALEDQKLLVETIAKYKKEGIYDEADVEGKAQGHVNRLKAAREEKLKAARERIALLDRLDVARIAGNHDEIRSLEEQLELSRLIAGYKGNPADAKKAAQDQVKALNEAERIQEKRLLSERKIDVDIQIASESGDGAEVEKLTKIVELRRRTNELIDIGVDSTKALSLAQDEQAAFDEVKAKQRTNDEIERALDLQIRIAGIKGDGAEVERLARIAEIRQRIVDLMQAGKTEIEAIDQANKEQKALDEAIALSKKNYELERELDFKLLLAQESGNTKEQERLEKEIKLLRTKNDLMLGGASSGQALKTANKQQLDLDKAHLKGELNDVFNSSLRQAFADKSLKSGVAALFDGVGDRVFDKALDNLSSSLADIASSALSGLFGGGKSGGIGGFLSSLFSFDGGGFTGRGSRSGGVDGKGGFAAILHPNETVVDHTKGLMRPQSTPVISRSNGGGTTNTTYAPVSNFYGFTEDDLTQSLDVRDRQLKRQIDGELKGKLAEHSFDRERGFA